MLSKRYDSTEVEGRTWLQVPSVTSSLVHQQLLTKKLKKYKKRLLRRCIHHFKSDLIDNMEHMRILGTKPSSVILSQVV